MSGIRAPAWLEPLLRELAANPPDRALLLIADEHPLARTLGERLPHCAFTLARNAVDVTVRYPLAIVAGILETLEPAAARHLLASLRDRVALHTVLWLDTTHSALPEEELRTLGFRIHTRDSTQVLAGFDLQDYKDRPDWLNARHWAHPERWDKFRW